MPARFVPSVSFPAKMEAETHARLDHIGSNIADTARRIVPVDTGDLQGSIGYEVGEDRVQVYADSAYAATVELGDPSRNEPMQAYLRPAASQVLGGGA